MNASPEPGAPAPLVDAVDVIRLVGPRAFSRAKEYARDDHVLSSSWDVEGQALTAEVRGSVAAPYRCRVVLAPGRGEHGRPTSSECSCPLGGDCKHVAAALLANNARVLTPGAGFVQAASTAGGAGWSTGIAGDDETVASSGGAAGASISTAAGPGTGPSSSSDWRSRLSQLTDPPRPVDARTTRMGLLFERRPRARPSRSRWDAPSPAPLVDAHDRASGGLGRGGTGGGGLVTGASPGGPAGASWRLGVRPVSLSRTGNWVRGDLTWTSLPYQMNRLQIAADVHAWFGQFAALHRSVHAAYVPGESDWLMLDDFSSPLLWPLLDEADRLGIALVTGKRSTDVTVASSARVSVDARRDDDGGLVLVAGVTVDGALRTGDETGTVADHGVYLVTPDPSLSIVLAPTPVPLGDEQRRLLTSAREVVVPADDADEFLRDFYPSLQQAVAVTSSDDSVVFPEVLPPQLVLTAAFGTGDSLTLAWHWEVAGRVVPLGSAAPAPGVVVPDVESWGVPARGTRLRGVAAAEFAHARLPDLEARRDVRVDVVGERPDYRELTEAPHLTVTTIETDKRDWFDLGVLVTIEGRTVPFVPLLTALAKRQRKMLLVDKSYLSLTHPAFDELKRLIDEATSLDEWEVETPRISRYQAGLWAEFDDLADATVQAESWRRTVGGLLALADAAEGADGAEGADDGDRGPAGVVAAASSVSVPMSVTATLRPYQLEGFRWLAFLYEHGLGGVLADDMGLGKTLQTLALVAHVRETEATAAAAAAAAAAASAGSSGGGDSPDAPTPAPFLVVAPTSVVSGWAAEAARFTPGLTVRTITETEAKSRGSLREAAAEADVVVTSYALFRLDFAAYSAHSWAALVLDEAQNVKNPQSQTHRCAVDLDVPVTIAITGTPLENGLLDLWALFRIVAPGLLSTSVRFSDDWLKPIATGERPELLQALRRRIRPLMLRRTKELVAPELPEKQEQVLRVDLAPAHRELYDAFLQRERLKLLDLIDDLDRNRFIVFRSLTLLRMLALDAVLMNPAYDDVPSAKLDQLLDEIDDVVAGGHRALVFSQFTSFLSRVADRLAERGVAHEYLDGSTRRRADVIERFRSGGSPVFLISLKAGGVGLNLTEADYVFVLDPWWNPAAESQAVDRAHRIGQTKRVMVYRMIANDTIEEKVLALSRKKAALFDAVVDDDAVFSSSLTADDIRGLLDA
ncbi:DEAD/DEAH box helicase [Frigoribacterium sp. CFBP 8766]|uniref:DEAD/DEAH box helicase n=1 Tax=Frigoribacterium sp. CFBP 8766 TaxID=2775273 RepID=UPI00177F1B29|nr:DEAD/DEAH box helicase [Frigoribacterium sp. CFBP 8766]MBD8584187.1 DEAD/DEAH box helicase [Frigoribacterium sp. CFBP 8766]